MIDDDEIALETIRSVLADAGYEVICLSSPIGATRVIMSEGIDAVVVDLNMPVMRGDRFISLLRSWDRICDLPTVLISGSSTETLESVAANMPGVFTVTKDSMRKTLPLALQRGLSKEKTPASANRRTGDLNADEKRAITAAAGAGLSAIADSKAGKALDWEPLLRAVRTLRDQLKRAGVSQLFKAVGKLVELVERSAEAGRLSFEARQAMRGALGLFTDLDDANTASNLTTIAAMHVTRLERALEDLSK
ncbi:MAG: response regulator [Myxococcales bacterium]